jgi:hypothetical protein
MPKKFNDLSGAQFGRYTVTDQWRPRRFGNSSNIKWLCQCTCGSEPKWVMAANLLKKTKPTKSCGCLNRDNLNARFVALDGRTFTRWSVSEKWERRDGDLYWFCICACTTERWVTASSLLNGSSRSCGCIQSETKTA